MQSRTSILSVYGPVLLAAVLILAVAPTCVMPSCAGVAVSSADGCEQPATSKFKSACTLEGTTTERSAPEQPCHDESFECDTTMTHGAPEAVPTASVSVPDVSPVAALLVSSDVAVDGYVSSTVVTYDAHPPDPLGVRLMV